MLIPLIGFGLIACASSGSSAPIVDRYNPSERAPDTYIVSRGDTLFSIAWRYGFDVKGLAAANRIRPPYTIYPGQALTLSEARSNYSPTNPSSKSVSKTVKPAVPKAVVPEAVAISKPAEKVLPANSSAQSAGWNWPVEGRVVRGFVATGQAHKGIDIGGKIGEPVRAAQSGVVVYSGSGLVGYGNLLILKHSERHLSAYGHNRKLMVKEGEQVKSGQIIAELGDSGTDTAKLHFEVRIDGKPVDPLRLLPRRN